MILSTFFEKEVQPFPPCHGGSRTPRLPVWLRLRWWLTLLAYRQTARCVLPRESVDWRTSRHPIHRVDHTISQVWGIKPRLGANAPSFFFLFGRCMTGAHPQTGSSWITSVARSNLPRRFDINIETRSRGVWRQSWRLREPDHQPFLNAVLSPEEVTCISLELHSIQTRAEMSWLWIKGEKWAPKKLPKIKRCKI